MIRLTSEQLKGSIKSEAGGEELEKIFPTAPENKFTIILEYAVKGK
jgi:hypothetical protein